MQYTWKQELHISFNPTDNCNDLNTLRTGDADLRFYISTMQDG